MTTIITRLYPDMATAKRVASALMDRGHDEATISILTQEGDGSAMDRMARARIPSSSAAAYAPGLAKGQALVVVQAPFAPMGTARDAIRSMNRTPAINVGIANEDYYIREEPNVETSGKIMHGTVFFMSNPLRPMAHGHVLGQNPILPPRERRSAISGGAYMSKMFWPMKLVSTGRQANSAISGGFLFSSLFGLPTIVREWSSREMIPTKV
jgi:hypothetical protein